MVVPALEVGGEGLGFFGAVVVEMVNSRPVIWVCFEEGEEGDRDDGVKLAVFAGFGDGFGVGCVPIGQCLAFGELGFFYALGGVFIQAWGVGAPAFVGGVGFPCFAHLAEDEEGGHFAEGFFEPEVGCFVFFETAEDVAELVAELEGVLGPVGVFAVEFHDDRAVAGAIEEGDRSAADDVDVLELDAGEMGEELAGGGLEDGVDVGGVGVAEGVFGYVEVKGGDGLGGGGCGGGLGDAEGEEE